MNEIVAFNRFLGVWLFLSAVVLVYLLFKPAPYGRHERAGWGPSIRDKPGWVIMEIPAVGIFALLFFLGNRIHLPVAIVFLILWEFHYLYRTFLFPALLRGNETMPLAIVGFGFIFNVINGYLNGRYLFSLCPEYSIDWFTTPCFLTGTALFFFGFITHFTADSILRNLREPGESEFKIPYAGMYRWISCPNYLGEMITWAGWAIATWSLPGLAFFVWTFANLFPRALSNHRWYREAFAEYPKERKAIIPFVL